MELIAKTAVICIVVSLTALLLQRDTPELALLLTLGAVTVVMLFALSFYEEVQAIFAAVWQQSGLDGALFAPILKIIAISLVTRPTCARTADRGPWPPWWTWPVCSAPF